MNEDFVSFELAKKLKSNGFTIPTANIIAMYNELGKFHSLTTSADYYTLEDGRKYREFYDFNDFDEHDYIAPTLAQVMKWLRNEHKITIQPQVTRDNTWDCQITYTDESDEILVDMFMGSSYWERDKPTYESAALAGIEFTINHII